VKERIDLQAFHHQHGIRVRSFHVDRQNVVHNLQYFYFFEEARVEYVRSMGIIPIDRDTFTTHDKYFVARNTCDYIEPVYFDEILLIHTRISYVGTSSIKFEHIAVKQTGAVAARGEHVLVHVDAERDVPSAVPEEMRAKIRSIEGSGVMFGKSEGRPNDAGPTISQTE